MGKYYQKQEDGSYQEYENRGQACLDGCITKIVIFLLCIIAVIVNQCS